MHLSEPRLRLLARKMAREMQTSGAVRSAAGVDDLTTIILKALAADQKAEGEIEAEARAMLARQKSLPPPGTGEYQAAFQQARRAAASRKGFVL